MESIYWRHQNSITTFFCLLIALFANLIGHTQVTDQHKEEISTFIVEQFPHLLNLSKDYSSLPKSSDNLRFSLEREISDLDFRLNSNAIIEYGTAVNDGKELIISDKIVSFLINYSGKNFGAPSFEFECIVDNEPNIEAFYSSLNVISEESSLRKMIFRVVDNQLELRRISFASILPPECTGVTEVGTEVVVIETPSTVSSNKATTEKETETPQPPVADPEPSTAQSTVKVTPRRSSAPSIKISEARYIQGYAYIYGFVQNYQTGGRLTDLSLSTPIKVSNRDGFFAIQRPMTPDGYQELKLRYDYGNKYIKDKKLILVKMD